MKRYLDALIQSYAEHLRRLEPGSDERITVEAEIQRLRELQQALAL